MKGKTTNIKYISGLKLYLGTTIETALASLRK